MRCHQAARGLDSNGVEPPERDLLDGESGSRGAVVRVDRARIALISGLAAPIVYRSGVRHAAGLVLMMALSWLAYSSSRRPGAAPAPRPCASE